MIVSNSAGWIAHQTYPNSLRTLSSNSMILCVSRNARDISRGLRSRFAQEAGSKLVIINVRNAYQQWINQIMNNELSRWTHFIIYHRACARFSSALFKPKIIHEAEKQQEDEVIACSRHHAYFLQSSKTYTTVQTSDCRDITQVNPEHGSWPQSRSNTCKKNLKIRWSVQIFITSWECNYLPGIEKFQHHCTALVCGYRLHDFLLPGIALPSLSLPSRS